MVITVEEARAYSRDYESTDEEMAALIEVAESMIDDGIRDGFDRESPQAKMLAKLLVTDLDDYRDLTAAEANSMRYLTQSLKMHPGLGRCEAMAKRANAGELRTKIMVFDLPRDEHGEVELGPDGYPASKPVNVFGEGKTRYCKWVNAWGTEVYTARQAGVTEPATLTLRYTPLITTTCIIYRGTDPKPYEVISVNDVENRHAWLEVKVQRKGAVR